VTKLAKREATVLCSNVDQVNNEFKQHGEKAILVSPATSVRSVPEGTEVAFSHFFVNTNKDSGETYDVGGGKFALSRVVLDKIAAQAGVNWDPVRSRRLDDGSDPHYCCYFACGRYRQFDGSEVGVQGTKEMDLREGSAQVLALVERYETKLAQWHNSGKRGYPPKDPRSGQIREMRLHILAHAESKARLRAIRAMGIKSAYTADELKRPIVVARLMWTGHTNDPELRKEAFRMRMQAMMGAGQAMYGAVPTLSQTPSMSSLSSLAPTIALPPNEPPPPVGSTYDDVDDIPYESGTESREEHVVEQPVPQNDEPCITFGKNKGMPLSQLTDNQLAYYISIAEKSIADPEKQQFRKIAEMQLSEYRTEMNERKKM